MRGRTLLLLLQDALGLEPSPGLLKSPGLYARIGLVAPRHSRESQAAKEAPEPDLLPALGLVLAGGDAEEPTGRGVVVVAVGVRVAAEAARGRREAPAGDGRVGGGEPTEGGRAE